MNNLDGEVVSVRVKPTESTTLAKLGIVDQFKLLVSKFNNNDADELKAQESLSVNALKMQASLEKLIRTAAEKIDGVNHNSVTLSVSSKYIPYMDDVIDAKHGLGRFYEFEVHKKDLPITVDYKFIVIIKRRVS